LIAIISFSKPYSKSAEEFKIISVSLPVNQGNFTIPVTKQIKELSLTYKNFTIYITTITETGKKTTSAGNFSLTGKSVVFIIINLTKLLPPTTDNTNNVISTPSYYRKLCLPP
ncbi:MAG TPA: hypothetical protein VFQ59_03725, partial [Candidatus Paceibacterota bacterium]|nr:hypothetical protein [Candidatus Paceibacterota bacterium]